ncbi:MAG: hypothetical protein WBB27_12090 [Maribacter sp.]
MKNTFLYLFTTLFTITGLAQTTITNFVTEAHIQVDGTKISLVPPANFTTAENFSGFQQNESGASIMVLDIPGPFSEVSKGFTEEGLKTQGMQLVATEELLLNSLPAILIKAEQSAYGNIYLKYIMAFGSEEESHLINGTFPKESEELDEVIKQSLFSAFYDPNKEINPFDAVDFEISTEDTGIIFANSMSNALLFSRDGKVPSTSPDQASLIVAKAFSELEILDKKSFCENRIKQLPFQIEEITSTKSIEIDDMQGFEVLADAINSSTNVVSKVYQVILFTDSLYYIILGSAEGDFETNLKAFRTIAKTFKRK